MALERKRATSADGLFCCGIQTTISYYFSRGQLLLFGVHLHIQTLCNSYGEIGFLCDVNKVISGRLYSGINLNNNTLRDAYPVTTLYQPKVGVMLAHRLRRWPNIAPTLGQRFCLMKTTSDWGVILGRVLSTYFTGCLCSGTCFINVFQSLFAFWDVFYQRILLVVLCWEEFCFLLLLILI